VQLIFQDPIASLNPRRRIGEIIAEPLVISGVKDPKKREQLVCEVLSAVGLDPSLVIGRLPHEFSGGQCQRICIARALVLNPEFIICDEPVSALDVSIRAQILNLLEDMKARFGLTLLFIAHDLAVVKAVSDRVAVMYLGRLCEVGPSEQLFAHPAHPYTALRCPIRTCALPKAWRSASRHRRFHRPRAAVFAPAAPERTSDASTKCRSFGPWRRTNTPPAIIH
jgi:peptide/nickel transport system ATP-binding protein